MGTVTWGDIVTAAGPAIGGLLGGLLARSGAIRAAKIKAVPPDSTGNHIFTGVVTLVGVVVGVVISIVVVSVLSNKSTNGKPSPTETSALPEVTSPVSEPSAPLEPPSRLSDAISKLSLSGCDKPSKEDVLPVKEYMPPWQDAYKCRTESGRGLNVYVFDFDDKVHERLDPQGWAKDERGQQNADERIILPAGNYSGSWRDGEQSGKCIKYFQGIGDSRVGNIWLYDDRSDAIDGLWDVMIVSWSLPDGGSQGSDSFGRGIGFLKSKGYSFDNEFEE